MRFIPTVLAVAALTLVTAAAGAATTPASKGSGGGIVPYEPQKWVVSASLGFGDAGYYGSGASPVIGVCAEYVYNAKIATIASAGRSGDTYE